MRLSTNDKGQLLDEDSVVRGSIVSLSLRWGREGGDLVSTVLTIDLIDGNTSNTNNTDDKNTNGTTDKIARAWAHYQRCVEGAKRRKLEDKRRRIIREALKVRELPVVLKAIEGLAASPHHNGFNDRKQKYLGIQYALKGIGAEGNDERIDKMAALANPGASGLLASVPSAAREMVRSRQKQVELALLSPNDPNLRSRAADSTRYLREQFGLVGQLVNGKVRWSIEPGFKSR